MDKTPTPIIPQGASENIRHTAEAMNIYKSVIDKLSGMKPEIPLRDCCDDGGAKMIEWTITITLKEDGKNGWTLHYQDNNAVNEFERVGILERILAHIKARWKSHDFNQEG